MIERSAYNPAVSHELRSQRETTLVTTKAVNIADVVEVDKLPPGKEKTAHADAGYTGTEKRAPKRGRKWHIAAEHGSIKTMPEGELKDATRHAGT